LDRRTTIGIVMVKYDLDDDRVFAVLQRLSSHENCKLYDLARDVVATKGLPASSGWDPTSHILTVDPGRDAQP
jgi:hypothetical protein